MVVRERGIVPFRALPAPGRLDRVMGIEPVEVVEREESIPAAHRDGF